MSVQIEGIVSLFVMRGDKKFSFMVPNGTSHPLAYDACMEILSILYAEVEKEKIKHEDALKAMNEPIKDIKE